MISSGPNPYLYIMKMDATLLNLLKKYNLPGPRYTSYPTVPAWTREVGPLEYRQGLSSLKEGEPLSLYFHLPFCERLCHFCGCMQVITTDHSRSRRYVDILLQEVDRVAALLPPGAREVSQVHFGGGTPNFLQPEELTDIVERVRKHFEVRSDAEWAIEMHPRTSTSAFCENLSTLGFNRISLGIQDFDPIVQKLLNRNQTYEMTESMVTFLRKLGFDSFNFDLVYGLPGQTMAGWEDSLAKVLYLKPDRLAVYSYAHVPWVRPVQRTFKDEDIPVPELKLELFLKAYATLLENGYRAIGMDHFALAEDELSRAMDDGTLHRNFMGYSTRADAHQVGFGMSAISYVGGNYFQNLKKLPLYEETLQGGKFATFRGFMLGSDDAIRRDLITQIMCMGRVDLGTFEKNWRIQFFDYFAEDLENLNPLLEDHLLALDDKTLQATREGSLFLRNIAMAFDPYLEKIQSEAQNPTFSKTV